MSTSGHARTALVAGGAGLVAGVAITLLSLLWVLLAAWGVRDQAVLGVTRYERALQQCEARFLRKPPPKDMRT